MRNVIFIPKSMLIALKVSKIKLSELSISAKANGLEYKELETKFRRLSRYDLLYMAEFNRKITNLILPYGSHDIDRSYDIVYFSDEITNHRDTNILSSVKGSSFSLVSMEVFEQHDVLVIDDKIDFLELRSKTVKKDFLKQVVNRSRTAYGERQAKLTTYVTNLILE